MQYVDVMSTLRILITGRLSESLVLARNIKIELSWRCFCSRDYVSDFKIKWLTFFVPHFARKFILVSLCYIIYFIINKLVLKSYVIQLFNVNIILMDFVIKSKILPHFPHLRKIVLFK